MLRTSLAAAAIFLAVGNLPAAALFDSQGPLDVTIEAPLKQLSRQRSEETDLSGTFRYTDASGTSRSLPVVVSTRGRRRLELCDYPPLRLTFDRDQTRGTLLEGQRKLKLVRPCLRGRKAQDWLYLEFGVYRAYNIISDYSFRVRQLQVIFIDTESRSRRVLEQPAFFIEDDKGVAMRMGRERIRPPKVDVAQMSRYETTHNVLFQYLIGNTDFAVKRGPSGEGCCHNGRVISEPGKQRDWIVLPYDFDYAGIVDTDYAAPHEDLPIRKVTTRLYRGFCWQNDVLPESIELFNRNRAEIEAALVPSEVSRQKVRRANNYIGQFYRIVNDPEELQEKLYDNCREPGSQPLRDSAVSPRYARTK